MSDTTPQRIDGESAQPGPRLLRRVARLAGSPPVLKVVALLGALLVAALLWRLTPLASWISPAALEERFSAWRGHPLALPAVCALFVAASFAFIPLTILVGAAGIAFGPLLGFAYSALASLVAALAVFAAGALLGRDAVSRLTGPRMRRVSGFLTRRGAVAVAFARIVPVAPFTVVNLVAGAYRVPWGGFLAGSLVGGLPGMLAISFFGAQLAEVITRPGWRSALWLGAALALVVGLGLGLRAWARRRLNDEVAGTPPGE